MDPRHPELAISRMRELMEQYDRIEADMKKATTSAKLAQLEREGGLVVQEICLVAPRIHEAMMQTSRQRRRDLARGILNEPQDTLVEMPHDGYLSVDEAIEEKPVETGQFIREATPEEAKALDKAVEEIEKPKKKTTRKKKTAKKAK